MLCFVVLCFVVLCCVVLCCVALCCVVLCCVAFCSILSCSARWFNSSSVLLCSLNYVQLGYLFYYYITVPAQDCPFPLKPDLQKHLKLPSLFSHVAFV